MQRQAVVSCLGLVFLASALDAVLDPRGARPVENGYKPENCETQKSWPFCTDLDWGPKCPSGCRILGVMNKFDQDVTKRIEKLQNQLSQNKAKHVSADQVSKQTYDILRDKLVIDAGNNNNYVELAHNLRQRIVDLKIKIDRQLRILAALKDRVKDQVIEMQRLETDIDIKLRSCKGSCKGHTEYSVDKESNVELSKQVDQLEASSVRNTDVGALYVMKSRPLKDAVVATHFKSGLAVETKGPEAQRVDMFNDVKTMELVLEKEGSSALSPATISKVPGTSFTSSSSSSSTSSTSSGPSAPLPSSRVEPAKPITEFGGHLGDGFFGFSGGFENLHQPSTSHVSSKSVICTRNIRRFTEYTKDGPVERTEVLYEGGPECQQMADNTKTTADFHLPHLSDTPSFPSSSSSSTSSSSSSSSSFTSKTSHSGGTKGSFPESSKTRFVNPLFPDTGLDLHAFLTDDAEEDVPDFHARSFKFTHRRE